MQLWEAFLVGFAGGMPAAALDFWMWSRRYRREQRQLEKEEEPPNAADMSREELGKALIAAFEAEPDVDE
jgi:hypothetical protein